MSALLEKIEGLYHKFEEVSTLITDPAVIADMKRFVKLNKEYRDLEQIVNAGNRYKTLLQNIAGAKEILETENDPDLREMAKAELDELEPQVAPMEEEIKILLIPSDPEDAKNAIDAYRGEVFLFQRNKAVATVSKNKNKKEHFLPISHRVFPPEIEMKYKIHSEDYDFNNLYNILQRGK